MPVIIDHIVPLFVSNSLLSKKTVWIQGRKTRGDMSPSQNLEWGSPMEPEPPKFDQIMFQFLASS